MVPRRDPLLGPLLLVALLSRVLAATRSPLINADAFYYLESAGAFAAGRWGEGLRDWGLHPLFPILSGLLQVLIVDPWFAGACVNILGGTAALAPLHALAERGWGRPAARWTAAVYALHPVLSGMHGDVMTEGLFLAFAVGAVAALSRALDEGPPGRLGALAGALAGLSFLVRAEGLVLSLALPVVAVLVGRRRALRPALLVAAGAVLVASPWLIWMRIDGGAWSLSPRHSVTATVGAVKPAEEKGSGVEARLRERLGPTAAAPVIVGWMLLRVLWFVPAALAVVGAAQAGRRGRTAGAVLLWTEGAALTAVTLYAARSQLHVSLRYVSFSAALLLPWAGRGAEGIVSALAARPRGLVLSRAFALAVCALLAARTLDMDERSRHDLRRAADWLLETAGPGRRILAGEDAVAYHARARLLRVRTREGILEEVRSGRAEYLVFRDKDLEAGRDPLRRGLEAVPGVSLARRFGPEKAGVCVYRLPAVP